MIDWFLCLTLSQTTNFRLFQTERLCRRHFQVWWKWQEIFHMGRKHCGKRRNCLLRAIFPFPSVFKKVLLPGRHRWSHHTSRFRRESKKEKMVVTSNFFFSHDFRRLLPQWHQKSPLCCTVKLACFWHYLCIAWINFFPFVTMPYKRSFSC